MPRAAGAHSVGELRAVDWRPSRVFPGRVRCNHPWQCANRVLKQDGHCRCCPTAVRRSLNCLQCKRVGSVPRCSPTGTSDDGVHSPSFILDRKRVHDGILLPIAHGVCPKNGELVAACSSDGEHLRGAAVVLCVDGEGGVPWQRSHCGWAF